MGRGKARVGEAAADEVCLGGEPKFAKEVLDVPLDAASVATGGEDDALDADPLANGDRDPGFGFGEAEGVGDGLGVGSRLVRRVDDQGENGVRGVAVEAPGWCCMGKT